jgi:hypothetical protein
MIELQQTGNVLRGEQIRIVGDSLIYTPIPGQHVLDHRVGHGIAP